MIKLLTTTSDIKKCHQLKRSLDHFGWDYHFIVHSWEGFGDKIIKTYEYLKANPEVTHFFYSDAWDTFVLGTMKEALANIKDKEVILFSSERACYPHPDKAELYPESKSPFKFINGGGWFASSELFCKMVEAAPLGHDKNDQEYFTDRFLEGTHGIVLDYDCQVFQTIAFCPESDFNLTDILLNTITDTLPIFVHGNGHTPMDHIYKLIPQMYSLKEATEAWQDTPESHKRFNEIFADNVNADKKLKDYRDWIESNVFGFGERSFIWMWKLLIDDITSQPIIETDYSIGSDISDFSKNPAFNSKATKIKKNDNFSFLEIGVFRGQILGAVRLLAPKAKITGITPLDSSDGHWESDYKADIKLLHDTFNLKQPEIIKGLSFDKDVLHEAGRRLYDVIYIDGGHSYSIAFHDVYVYSSFVKVGGYLVIDDCCHKYNLPDGQFKGIEAVSKAVDELLPNEYYKEILSIVHNRVFQRVK